MVPPKAASGRASRNIVGSAVLALIGVAVLIRGFWTADGVAARSERGQAPGRVVAEVPVTVPRAARDDATVEALRRDLLSRPEPAFRLLA